MWLCCAPCCPDKTSSHTSEVITARGYRTRARRALAHDALDGILTDCVFREERSGYGGIGGVNNTQPPSTSVSSLEGSDPPVVIPENPVPIDPAEKKKQLLLLKEFVRSFATDMVTGIDVSAINQSTGAHLPVKLSMDRSLTVVQIEGCDDKEAVLLKELPIAEINEFVKGVEVKYKLPDIPINDEEVVAIEYPHEAGFLVLRFGKQFEADKFLACTRILQTSQMSRSKTVGVLSLPKPDIEEDDDEDN
eukprot:Platyproteum_vivax@DN254_c0_g1_i1.p1